MLAIFELLLLLIGILSIMVGFLWPILCLIKPSLKQKRRTRDFFICGVCALIISIGSSYLFGTGGEDIKDKNLDEISKVGLNETITENENYEIIINEAKLPNYINENGEEVKDTEGNGIVFIKGKFKNISDSSFYFNDSNVSAYIVYDRQYFYETDVFAVVNDSSEELYELMPIEEVGLKIVGKIPNEVKNSDKELLLLLTVKQNDYLITIR